MLRVAFLNGATTTAGGTSVHIYDFYLDGTGVPVYPPTAQTTVHTSRPTGKFGKPQLSRDAQGITLYAQESTGGAGIAWPYFADLGTGLVPSTSILLSSPADQGCAAGYVNSPSTTTLSTTLRPPAISDRDGGGDFMIVFPDLDQSGPNPAIYWHTGSTSGIPNNITYCTTGWTEGWTDIGMSSDGQWLCHTAIKMADGNIQQVYRAHGTAPNWTSSDTRLSTNTSGSYGGDISFEPQIDKAGTYVVFTSRATDLRTGDTNGMDDIYWVGSGLPQLAYADPGSYTGAVTGSPTISPDHVFIGFHSTNRNFLMSGSNPDYSGLTNEFCTYSVTRTNTSTLALESYLNPSSGTRPVAIQGQFPSIVSWLDSSNPAHPVFRRQVLFESANPTLASRSGINVILMWY